MRAKEVLLTALEKFTGTVVFVSHDRYFIDQLATRVFEVEDGAVHVFPGNYEDYLWRKAGGGAAAQQFPANGRAPVPPEAAPATTLRRGASRPQQSAPPPPPAAAAPQPQVPKPGRLNPIKLKQMKERRRAIEDEVTRLEVEIADYEAALANFKSAEESIRVSELLMARRTDLEALIAEWEQVAESIEANQ